MKTVIPQNVPVGVVLLSSSKKLLIQQVNSAPEPLRSYIHALTVGIDADIILLNEQLRQENSEMKHIIETWEGE